MAFLPLLILAFVLYSSGKRVGAYILFFFFFLEGFQLIPEAWFGIKPVDYALLFVIGLFVWGCIVYEDFIPKNKLTLFIGIFLGFILFECLLSRFYYHIDWESIFRTGRQSLFVLVYFLFRRLEKKEIWQLTKILLIILSVQSVLFIAQSITGIGLLTESEGPVSNGWFYRFYNVPILMYILVFFAVFANPFTGRTRIFTTLLPILVMFAPMHRSLIGVFVIVLMVGFLLIHGWLKSTKNILIAFSVISIIILILGIRLSSRGASDIERVTEGEFMDTDNLQLEGDASLLFRIGHFTERYLETTETPIGTLLGLGFMSEDSKYTENHFNFIIGLSNTEKGGIAQVDTSDIAWSIFIIRYGILGTFVYLLLYGYIVRYYWKIKDHFSISMVLSLILVIGISFTSDQLYYTTALVFPLLYYDFYYET